ncbi:hypothetical protein [Haloferula sp.]|uniref:hypothetical protein n=1 Tax=Haloferula sp. TaxID=2497595 RepID=UPI003C78AA7C
MPLRILLCLILVSGLHAENRIWKSADGSSSFNGEFVSMDVNRVTVLRTDGRSVTFDIDKLCEEDRKWLAGKSSTEAQENAPMPEADAVFDTLCFGDSRKEVEAKLKASEMLETAVDETFFGRFGLNGTFRTKKKIGGLYCELFFDWTKAGNLKEISLQTKPQDVGTYDDLLRNNWNQLAELLIMLHGKPLQRAEYPDHEDLQNDALLGSHLWRLEGGGSVILGTSMQANQYMVIVRFTTEKIEPVLVP